MTKAATSEKRAKLREIAEKKGVRYRGADGRVKAHYHFADIQAQGVRLTEKVKVHNNRIVAAAVFAGVSPEMAQAAPGQIKLETALAAMTKRAMRYYGLLNKYRGPKP